MSHRIGLLRQLITDSLYVVDERAVADALMARAELRAAVADWALGSLPLPAQPRCLRRDANALPFQLTRSLGSSGLRR